MTPFYSKDGIVLYCGDCVAVMQTMPDNSIDAIVTDPPYGLGFMGKGWDHSVPGVEVWIECLRILKPGGHLLSFAGTRTQHRMACAIEDAGFEIRDMIAWVYGSGFPKSLDVSKAIDKAAGAQREVVGPKVFGGGHLASKVRQKKPGTQHEGWERPWQESQEHIDLMNSETAPATEAARQWSGWGTALKPSFESLTFATKPLDVVGYCTKMISNLTERIESCKQSASNAAKSSRHSQADLQGVTTNTVQESAAIRTVEAQGSETETGLADDTSSEVDTSASVLATEGIDLSTLLSWRHTLEGVFYAAKTSTTSTVFETITDWKILNFCLSQITPGTITQARCNPNGLSANVLRAVEYLSVSLACCENTLTLSALAPVMSQVQDSLPDETVKPNLDAIVMARKPLIGTVAANVMQYGTGGINVDACRVGTGTGETRIVSYPNISGTGIISGHGNKRDSGDKVEREVTSQGRWPANLIHDGSDEVLALFPESDISPTPRSGGFRKENAERGNVDFKSGCKPTLPVVRGDTGSAARFFYTPKADSAERRQSKHPTVKPLDLMRYLVRLVCPAGGIVLDPFMGSGSTIEAARAEHCKSIGMDLSEEYCGDAVERLRQGVLNFGEGE